jgi:hypothetical protein
MAVTKKNAVFYDVTLRGSCKNRGFGETHRLHHQYGVSVHGILHSVLQLLVTSNIPSSDSCHLGDGGDKFLQNIKRYTSQRMTFLTN